MSDNITFVYKKDGAENSEAKAEAEDMKKLTSVVMPVADRHNIQGPVLCVVYDDNIQGEDNTVWGGEFLLGDREQVLTVKYTKDPVISEDELHAIPANDEAAEKNKEPEIVERSGKWLRMGFLQPVHLLKGKGKMKNAQLVLACMMNDAEDRGLIWEDYESDQILDPNLHQNIAIALDAGIDTYVSTSLLRLFDAAAVVLGICEENTYPGECARKLAEAAHAAIDKWNNGTYGMADQQIDVLKNRYPVRMILNKKDGEWIADGPRLIGDLRMARDGGIPVEELALEFHDAISEMTVRMCGNISADVQKDGICVKQVILSGAIFEDDILKDRVVRGLQNEGYAVLF
ncbi:MAG: hypothetical protein LIV24_04975 [Eubacterium sp.]|nr:hypothetical protein [Eubacterium sp.]